MTVWFLFTALLLTAGQPASTQPFAFATQEACEQAGAAFVEHVATDPKVDQAKWTCAQVDFDKPEPRA